MVGASSIGFYAEPANPRRVNEVRAEKTGAGTKLLGAEQDALGGEDDLQISAAAQLLALANDEDDQIQAERVDEIRQSLEQGTYRVQEVLLKVAARIARYIE